MNIDSWDPAAVQADWHGRGRIISSGGAGPIVPNTFTLLIYCSNLVLASPISDTPIYINHKSSSFYSSQSQTYWLIVGPSPHFTGTKSFYELTLRRMDKSYSVVQGPWWHCGIIKETLFWLIRQTATLSGFHLFICLVCQWYITCKLYTCVVCVWVSSFKFSFSQH